MRIIKSAARRAVNRRAAAFALLAVVAVFSLGARCIERTSVHVDSDGYTHITGEMVNDTDVQGTRVMLRGTLYDGAGNVLATKDAPTCPPDTQPHQQTTFDIRFDNPNIPPHASFEVRPVSAITLTEQLPSPDVVLFFSDAARFEDVPPIPGLGITDNDVLLTFNGRNRSGVTYEGVQGCSAVYDNQGNVIHVQSAELIQVDEAGNPQTASVDSSGPFNVFMVAEGVPKGPVQVRAWLWFGPKGSPTSQYQFVATPMITIQTIQF